jgi:hypothetical protein
MYQPKPSTLESIDINFSCPPMGDAEVDSKTAIRAAFRDLAEFLVHHTPDCPSQVFALRHLAKAQSEAMDCLAPMVVARYRNFAAPAEAVS